MSQLVFYDDFIYAHSNLIMIHSKDGGLRTINLRNGTAVNLNIPPLSTLLLDADSGKERLK
jgi:hypothetical protein